MKHNKLTKWVTAFLGGAVLVAATSASWAAPGGNSSPQILPPNSSAFGTPLCDWLKIYCAWSYGQGPASGMVGKVMLLPMPSSTVPSGQGTVADPLIFVGKTNIVIAAGTPFFLPVVEWLGEVYQNGVKDPAFPDDWFGRYYGAEVKLDGKPILTDLKSYYVKPVELDPPILYGSPTEYGSTGIACLQGAGFVCAPLSPGVHHLTVRAWFLVPADNGIIAESGFIFENSWTLTVTK